MHTIKAVGVFSVAKVMGAIYAAMGLLFLPLFLLMGVVTSMIPKQNGQNPFGLVFGLVFALFAPIMYGAIGFIFGAIFAFVYNLVAKWLGGIEVQVQLASPSNP